MNTKMLRAMCIGASIAAAVALSACAGSSHKNRADMAESELDALQEAFGENELTADAITALRNMIAALMGRAHITPEDLQALRDQVAMLEGRADITPEDIQALRDEVAMLMGRADITPQDLQALRDQVAMLMGRADITPADLQALRDEVAMLMGRADITPEDLQALRDEVAMLEGRADITPEDIQALHDEIAVLARQMEPEKLIGVSLPVGLFRSAAAPIHATDPQDTLATLLPDAQNRFAPLSSTMQRNFGNPQSSELVDSTYITSISSDGNNGFRVTYVVDGQERMVHFEEADYDSQDVGFTKDVDGIAHALYARTDAFEGPDKNQGSSEFEYFDANLVFVSSPSRRIFTTYGARTEAANLPAGTADYLGRMESYNHDRNSPDNALRIRVRGDLALNADFDASTLEGQIDRIRVRAADEAEYSTLPGTTRFAIEDGRIIDGQFAAALTGEDSNADADLDETVRGYEGDILGEFYGPSAEEVGGVLNAESEAHDRVMHGWFGGKQRGTLDPRIPAGNLSILSALLDWDENTETVRPSDTQVTAVESDGAAGLYVTYSVDGAEHSIHLPRSDFDERNAWYLTRVDNRHYYVWNLDGSFTEDDEEFSYFNVNGWFESNDAWPPSDVTRGYIVYGTPTETLPATGTAEYAGQIYAEAFATEEEEFGESRIRIRSDSLALTADFGQSTVGGTIDDIEVTAPGESDYGVADGQFTFQNGRIADGRLTADLSGSQDLATYDIDVNGQFFGPAAAEVGGELRGANSAEGTVVQGWFGAKQ